MTTAVPHSPADVRAEHCSTPIVVAPTDTIVRRSPRPERWQESAR